MNHNYYKELEGKNIVITGGAGGIGACLTKNYLLLGSNVHILDNSNESINLLKQQTEKYSANLKTYCTDLTNKEDLEKTLQSISSQLDSLSVLINNAANDMRHEIDDISEDLWTEAINSNLKHYVFMISHFKALLANAQGCVINMASNAYGLGLDGYPLYVMCKGGITGITRGMAKELAKSKIRINSVLPGWVMTERQKTHWATPQAIDECLSQQSIKSLMEPEDIFGTCFFLSTSMSSMITGQSIVVDGGRYFN